MATLHVFNPEHDIALADFRPRFTPPRAGRQLRHDLGFLPALWAEEEDMVLVDDKPFAIAALEETGITAECQFITYRELYTLASRRADLQVSPWGCDPAIYTALEQAGVVAKERWGHLDLEAIRAHSHRGWAARHLLPQLTTQQDTIGEAWEATAVSDVLRSLNRYDRLMLKQPWSSSGRGVRPADAHDLYTGSTIWRQTEQWIANTISKQGSVMVEPLYNKVEDFGMEFWSDGEGTVSYCGLSLFRTERGAYTGNWLATEADKTAHLTAVGLSADLLHATAATIIATMSAALHHLYRGPFGVDMMVTDHEGRRLLHPCVELNLRRTMGHVALSLTQRLPTLPATMQVSFDGSYKLKISRDTF